MENDNYTDPCQNGGSCNWHDYYSYPLCDCPKGFEGDFCELPAKEGQDNGKITLEILSFVDMRKGETKPTNPKKLLAAPGATEKKRANVKRGKRGQFPDPW